MQPLDTTGKPPLAFLPFINVYSTQGGGCFFNPNIMTKNAIIIEHELQAFLIKKAIANQIKREREKGFKETDPEIKLLHAALPKIKTVNALPTEL